MTDLERSERVIAELSALLLELHAVGLGDDVVLIGAQVVALEQRRREVPVFQLSLPSGIEVLRGSLWSQISCSTPTISSGLSISRRCCAGADSSVAAHLETLEVVKVLSRVRGSPRR